MFLLNIFKVSIKNFYEHYCIYNYWLQWIVSRHIISLSSKSTAKIKYKLAYFLYISLYVWNLILFIYITSMNFVQFGSRETINLWISGINLTFSSGEKYLYLFHYKLLPFSYSVLTLSINNMKILYLKVYYITFNRKDWHYSYIYIYHPILFRFWNEKRFKRKNFGLN